MDRRKLISQQKSRESSPCRKRLAENADEGKAIKSEENDEKREEIALQKKKEEETALRKGTQKRGRQTKIAHEQRKMRLTSTASHSQQQRVIIYPASLPLSRPSTRQDVGGGKY